MILAGVRPRNLLGTVIVLGFLTVFSLALVALAGFYAKVAWRVFLFGWDLIS